MVQLETVVFVVSCKQKGDAEGTKSTALGVELFVVTDMFHKLFYGDGFLILVFITTCSKTRLIDQNVGIGR